MGNPFVIMDELDGNAVSLVFFGERWDAPVTDNALQVETPVGDWCVLCDRAVAEGEQGFMQAIHDPASGATVTAMPMHRGCQMADTMGHIFGVCPCTGWEDTYTAGVELVRRADAGELREIPGRP